MSRTNFSGGRKDLDAPLLERPMSDATKGDRLSFHVVRAYLGLTVVYFVLGLITLAGLVINPALGAVTAAVALVGVLIYRA